MPTSTVAEVTAAPPQPAARWKAPPAELLLRAMAVLASTLVGLPSASRASTVTAAEQAPAISACGAVVKASAAAGATPTLWIWLAVPSPAGATVTVGVPTTVSLK